MKCCSQFPLSGRISSPFTRQIVLGYYDGATEGIVKCSVCMKSWYYRMIAWDSRQDNRLFVLRLLPERSFESLEQFLQNVQPNRGQLGFPWSFESESEKIATDDFVARMIKAASTPAWIVVGKSIISPLRICAVTQEILDAILTAESGSTYENIEKWYEFFRD